MVKVLIKKLDPKVKLPIYKTEGSSGMDLMAFTDNPIKIPSNSSAIIPTGISLAIPNDVEIQIRPRSGLAAKSNIGILNSPGTIDSDYRGEIGVILINLSNEEFNINPGERIAQLVLAKHEQIKWKINEKLSSTVRGSDGFGSTGKK